MIYPSGTSEYAQSQGTIPGIPPDCSHHNPSACHFNFFGIPGESEGPVIRTPQCQFSSLRIEQDVESIPPRLAGVSRLLFPDNSARQNIRSQILNRYPISLLSKAASALGRFASGRRKLRIPNDKSRPIRPYDFRRTLMTPPDFDMPVHPNERFLDIGAIRNRIVHDERSRVGIMKIHRGNGAYDRFIDVYVKLMRQCHFPKRRSFRKMGPNARCGLSGLDLHRISRLETSKLSHS